MTVCLDRHEVYLSEHIIAELSKHLAGKLRLPKTRVVEIDTFLRENALIVVPIEVPKDACRDTNNLPVFGTMMAAGADCLVTGDADLLDLSVFEKIPIYSPRQFYDQLR
jgi:uncharacterized protein